MNSMPLISVVVPAYNAERYIERCIKSVWNQTYTNWQMIIIDDGSKDNTLEKAINISKDDKRIQVLYTENAGVCSARNKGIELARGEYIVFLDVDDELECTALEKLYTLCKEGNGDIAVGQYMNVTKSGEIVYNHYSEKDLVWVNEEALINSLKDHPAAYSVWGKIYKKKFIGDTRFVVGRKIHEDNYFLFELFLKKPKVIIKEEYIYRYHMTDNSASRTDFSEKYLDILYFAKKKKEIIENQYPQYEKYIPNLLVKADMALLINLCKTTDVKYRAIEKQCLIEVKKYKSFFVTAINENKRWFWILTHHLYKLYKIFYLSKRMIKQFSEK